MRLRDAGPARDADIAAHIEAGRELLLRLMLRRNGTCRWCAGAMDEHEDCEAEAWLLIDPLALTRRELQ